MTQRLVIRPVREEDLGSLYEMAGRAGYGLTSLPRDRELLHGKILESCESFARMGQKPRGESYLFVLEDLDAGRAVGTTGIVSKVGGFEPFYAYRIETAVAESQALKVHKEIQFLQLVTEHNGPCEIGSLFLQPEYRRDGNGRLLSLSRFVFMAEHPRKFDPLVLAELRGVVDEQGHSPFWDAVGRHFFDIEYPDADYLSVVDKRFIADLMPRHPIYLPLLPKAAHDVVGKAHPGSRPALEILRDEGFADARMIDIFDAGPIVSCPRDSIRSVHESRKLTVQQIVEQMPAGSSHIIAVPGPIFRACQGPIELTPDGVRLRASEAAALKVSVGESVRVVPLRKPPPEVEQVKPV